MLVDIAISRSAAAGGIGNRQINYPLPRLRRVPKPIVRLLYSVEGRHPGERKLVVVILLSPHDESTEHEQVALEEFHYFGMHGPDGGNIGLFSVRH